MKQTETADPTCVLCGHGAANAMGFCRRDLWPNCACKCEFPTAPTTESRSVLRRIAAQKGEQPPQFDHLPDDEKVAEIRERRAKMYFASGVATGEWADIDYLLSALSAARDEIATLDAENEELNSKIQVLQNRAREPVAEMWRPTTDKPETPAQILIHVRGFAEFGAFNGQWHLYNDGDHYILEEHEVDGWLPIPPLPAGPQENQEDGQ